MKTSNPRAWRVAEGEDAVFCSEWFILVIEGKAKMSEWTFDPPRKHGTVRPSTAQRMSKDRSGRNNPSVKAKEFLYTKEEVIESGRLLYADFVKDHALSFGDFPKALEKLYPNYKYLLCEELGELKDKYGTSAQCVITLCTGLSKTEITKAMRARRGEKISQGQRASPHCLAKASEMAAKLCSTWRVSVPHKKLYLMVVEFDPSASMERKVTTPTKTFSYDIFSPKANAMIEMHGRVWHDSAKAPEKLRELVLKNERNDKTKQELASSLGMRYTVFWDDQQDRWPQQLEELYADQKGENKVG
jgi:hypothetical protein